MERLKQQPVISAIVFGGNADGDSRRDTIGEPEADAGDYDAESSEEVDYDSDVEDDELDDDVDDDEGSSGGYGSQY